MAERLVARRDLEFLLYDWLDVQSLCARPRFRDYSRETFDAALDLAQRIATEKFAPHNRAADLDEPRFDGERVSLIPQIGEALKAFVDAGLMAAEHDEGYGGMQLPLAIAKACFAYIEAANVSSAAYPLLTIGNANLLLAHGSPAQIDAFVRPQLAGRFFGGPVRMQITAGCQVDGQQLCLASAEPGQNGIADALPFVGKRVVGRLGVSNDVKFHCGGRV